MLCQQTNPQTSTPAAQSRRDVFRLTCAEVARKSKLIRHVMRGQAASASARPHYRNSSSLLRYSVHMLVTSSLANNSRHEPPPPPPPPPSGEMSTLVDPVNATLSMPMCTAIAAPAVGPYPGKILTTPGGNPACQNSIRGNNL